LGEISSSFRHETVIELPPSDSLRKTLSHREMQRLGSYEMIHVDQTRYCHAGDGQEKLVGTFSQEDRRCEESDKPVCCAVSNRFWHCLTRPPQLQVTKPARDANHGTQHEIYDPIFMNNHREPIKMPQKVTS
jgi:hypothetical protein